MSEYTLGQTVYKITWREGCPNLIAGRVIVELRGKTQRRHLVVRSADKQWIYPSIREWSLSPHAAVYDELRRWAKWGARTVDSARMDKAFRAMCQVWRLWRRFQTRRPG